MPLIELDHASMIFRVREQYQITLKEFVLKGMFRRTVNPVMECAGCDLLVLGRRSCYAGLLTTIAGMTTSFAR